jgi:uncharacterized membrane protein YphA (DoxX/SURF4 family)
VNVLAWILTALLTAIFLVIAGSKLLQSRRKLLTTPNFEYVEDFTAAQIKGIGVLELLGALGLVLPALPGIPGVLAPLAALGLALTMVGAAAVHLGRGERNRVPANLVLIAVLVLLAVLRVGPASL